MIFYHGTTALYAAAIKEKGLIPKAGRGADYYAQIELHWSKTSKMAKRKPSVFLTPEKRLADWYARMTAEVNNSDPTIFEVDMPDTEVRKLIPDEAGNGTAAWGGRWVGVIPPDWIKGTVPLEKVPEPIPTRLAAILGRGTKAFELF